MGVLLKKVYTTTHSPVKLGSMVQTMMRLSVCLLFLSCVFCPATGQTYTSYSQMEPRLKSLVDLALNKANQQLDNSFGHLNFFSIGEVAQLTPRVRIDVRLKNTVCSKASGVHTHRPECAFLRLQVRCFVCSADPNTSHPWIDCVRHVDQKTRYALWDQHCVAPPPGAGVLNKGFDD